MTIPRLLVIADRFASGEPAFAERVLAAIGSGARWIQLRDHEADADTFARCAWALVEHIMEETDDVMISVNGHPELARALGAGLHVGRSGPPVADARRMLGDGLLSVAVHDPGEVAAAEAAGADVLVFAPVFPTPGKPGHPGAGLGELAAVCAAAKDTPVLALGGIRPDSVGACIEVGAYGVAVLSAIMDAPPAVVRIIVCALNYALEKAFDESPEADRPDHRGE